MTDSCFPVTDSLVRRLRMLTSGVSSGMRKGRGQGPCPFLARSLGPDAIQLVDQAYTMEPGGPVQCRCRRTVIPVLPPTSAPTSAAKLPLVPGPVSVLRHAVISVALLVDVERWPVNTKPTSVAGQFPGPLPDPATDEPGCQQ